MLLERVGFHLSRNEILLLSYGGKYPWKRHQVTIVCPQKYRPNYVRTNDAEDDRRELLSRYKSDSRAPPRR